jgi:flagellar export protein FliJ
MAFKFPLETVLRIRGILEEREERLLQQIQYEISQNVEDLARTDAGIAGSDASRSENVFKPLAGYNLHALYGEVKDLKDNREAVTAQIEKLNELRDKQLRAYEHARRNREMLTDMHEEQQNAYDSDAARREQKTVDDNYIARRGRP